ncbi:MAG: hypothetical protein FJ126_10130 [Deltaproteobacteria bacterium]|nr:hypothetical protein [Deltaproteobacteria bacterium]
MRLRSNSATPAIMFKKKRPMADAVFKLCPPMSTRCRAMPALSQARLKMGVLAYNLLHMIRKFYVRGEDVRRSIDWLIKRLIKVGARVSYHARRWYVHVASAFPLVHHYRAVLAWGS